MGYISGKSVMEMKGYLPKILENKLILSESFSFNKILTSTKPSISLKISKTSRISSIYLSNINLLLAL